MRTARLFAAKVGFMSFVLQIQNISSVRVKLLRFDTGFGVGVDVGVDVCDSSHF